VKFKSLKEKADAVDNLIDQYIITKNTRFPPKQRLIETVSAVFPNAALVNLGLHKLVFRLTHKTHTLALKVGKQTAIERDHRAYKQFPPSLRHVYFARVFWHTKYCLLQEYGVEAEVTREQLLYLRKLAYKYGLLDITCENIRSVNGELKIIDAGVAPYGLYRVWKTGDLVMRRLPTPVRMIIRKSRMLTAVHEFKS
jgi:hypothetical protein